MFDFEAASKAGFSKEQQIDFLRNKDTGLDWSAIEESAKSAQDWGVGISQTDALYNALKSQLTPKEPQNQKFLSEDELKKYGGTINQLLDFAEIETEESAKRWDTLNAEIAKHRANKTPFKELPNTLKEFMFNNKNSLISGISDTTSWIFGGDLDEESNVKEWYEKGFKYDDVLNFENLEDLKKANPQGYEDFKKNQGLFDKALNSIWFGEDGEEKDFQEFKEEIAAQNLDARFYDNISKASEMLKNISESHSVGNTIKAWINDENFLLNDAGYDFMQKFDKIATDLGADGVGYDKSGNIYIYKGEEAYKVNDGFFDNIGTIVESNLLSMAGSVSGGALALRWAKNLGRTALKGAKSNIVTGILGSAAGAALGGYGDSVLGRFRLNIEQNFADSMRHAIEQGYLDAVGGIVLVGGGKLLSKGKDLIAKVDTKNLGAGVEKIIDYTPFIGMAKRAQDGNQKAARELINANLSQEQQQMIKNVSQNFGGELTMESQNALKAKFLQTFGEDSLLSKGFLKAYDVLTLSSQKNAQKDFITAIRADESGNLIAFLSEAANASPKMQNNLRSILNQTTLNLRRRLNELSIDTQSVKGILDEFENGTKSGYARAMEDILGKVYDSNYKVVIDRAGGARQSYQAKTIPLQSIENAMKENSKIFVDTFENQALAKAIGLDTSKEIAMTLQGDKIIHALKRHGQDSALAKHSGKQAVTPEDIATFSNIVKNADLYAVNKVNDVTHLLAGKQINGHFVVVESISTKNNELKFKTFYKEKGNLENNADFKRAARLLTPQGRAYSPKSSLGVSLDSDPSRKVYSSTKPQSYNDFRKSLEERGILPEDSLRFLNFVEKNIYNKNGVDFSQLNNALKTINSYYKQSLDPNFKDFIKQSVENFLKDDIKKGIDSILAQNPILYKDASALFDTALKDYANMKSVLKIADKLKLRDEAIAYQKSLQNLEKYAMGQGNPESHSITSHNLNKLTSHLTPEQSAHFELNLLQNIFERAIMKNKNMEVFNSSAFLQNLEKIGEGSFKSPQAKEFITFAKDFNTLFKNDALIAQKITEATTEKIGSSIATTISGALKFQVVKMAFEQMVRLMPTIPFAKGINEKVQGAALRYHIKQALSRASDITDFRRTLVSRAQRGNFNNETLEIINSLTKQVDEAQENIIKQVDTENAILQNAPDMQTYQTLKAYNVKDLHLASQDEYKKFIDDVLGQDIEALKNAPNILHIANFDDELAKTLNLETNNAYLTKKSLLHFRPERKAGYNQELSADEIKQIPEIISNAKSAYIDITPKHNNFFITKELEDKVITINFNKDELGNYIVTARKVLKEDLNRQEYKLMGSGIEPHIERFTAENASLPSGSSPISSPNSTTPAKINQPSPLELALKHKEQALKEAQAPKDAPNVEPAPKGEAPNENDIIAEFGTNYAEFYHKPIEAFKKLQETQGGQVVGAYERKDLGDIDLVWGEYNKETQKGFGLSKILAKHPEITAEILEEIVKNGKLLDENSIKTIIYNTDNKIYRLGLSKGWKGKGENEWILTAYEVEKSQGSDFLPSSQVTKSDGTNLHSNDFSDNSTTNKNLIQDNPPRNSNENAFEFKELESKLSQINEGIEKSALEQKAQGGFMSETTKQILRDTRSSKILKPFEKAYFGKEYPKELERILADFGFESNKALSDTAIQLKNNPKAVIEDYKTSYKNQLQNEVQNTTAKKAKENLRYRLSQILPREQVQNLDNIVDTKLLSDIRSGKDLALYETIANEQIKRLREHIESTLNIQPIKDFGTNYAEFYHDGKGAIKKLLSEKQGQVAGAFYKENLGDIDLVWGEVTDSAKHTGFGLAHAIDKHGEEVALKIPEIIENGKVSKTHNGYNIVWNDYIVGVNKGFKDKSGDYIGTNHWVVTAFEDTQGKKEASSIAPVASDYKEPMPLKPLQDSTTKDPQSQIELYQQKLGLDESSAKEGVESSITSENPAVIARSEATKQNKPQAQFLQQSTQENANGLLRGINPARNDEAIPNFTPQTIAQAKAIRNEMLKTLQERLAKYKKEHASEDLIKHYEKQIAQEQDSIKKLEANDLGEFEARFKKEMQDYEQIIQNMPPNLKEAFKLQNINDVFYYLANKIMPSSITPSKIGVLIGKKSANEAQIEQFAKAQSLKELLGEDYTWLESQAKATRKGELKDLRFMQNLKNFIHTLDTPATSEPIKKELKRLQGLHAKNRANYKAYYDAHPELINKYLENKIINWQSYRLDELDELFSAHARKILETKALSQTERQELVNLSNEYLKE
ncbi:hypothetical protein CQA49_09515, partial [Helicobacter sp. MIT 00-7814]